MVAIDQSEILHKSVLTKKYYGRLHWGWVIIYIIHLQAQMILYIRLLKDGKEMVHILVHQNISDGCSVSTAKYWTDAKPMPQNSCLWAVTELGCSNIIKRIYAKSSLGQVNTTYSFMID